MNDENIINVGSIFKMVFDKNFEKVAQKHGLKRTEIAVMMYLGMNEGKNVASVDIVKELLLTKSHVSISVNGLAARGLLVKVADRNDRKKEYLILTPQAKDIFEDIKHQRAVLLKQMFTGLTTEEVKTLQSLIARVVHNIVPGY